MAKIIAFANQKGGVGKTTSCVNVASAFVSMHKKVLLVDLDPQGNATMGSGVDKSEADPTVNEVLVGDAKIIDAILKNTPAGYDLLPANGNLTAAEVALVNLNHKEVRLRDALKQIKGQYNFIFIDCPPALNTLTLNALAAANSIIIPMQCEYYALEGLSALIGTMQEVKRKLNPSLYLEGIIRTMFDPRNRLSQDVAAELDEHFKSKVYKVVIPRNVRLAEAPSHGLPILLYDKQSRGAVAYKELASEILKASKAAESIAFDS